MPPVSDPMQRAIYLPESQFQKTIIFDMDETLIHCVDDIDEEKPQHIIDIEFEDNEIVQAGINIRPFAFECLKSAKELFQVVVFTASHKSYADAVLDFLDPENELIDWRLYRDSCYQTPENVYIKDLRIIQNRCMEDLIIVDNAVYSFGFQMDNGIPIIPYYNDDADEELYHLIPYLEILSKCPDIRTKNAEVFQLSEMENEPFEEVYNSQGSSGEPKEPQIDLELGTVTEDEEEENRGTM